MKEKQRMKGKSRQRRISSFMSKMPKMPKTEKPKCPFPFCEECKFFQKCSVPKANPPRREYLRREALQQRQLLETEKQQVSAASEVGKMNT
jgi:hypothetical protein